MSSPPLISPRTILLASAGLLLIGVLSHYFLSENEGQPATHPPTSEAASTRSSGLRSASPAHEKIASQTDRQSTSPPAINSVVTPDDSKALLQELESQLRAMEAENATVTYTSENAIGHSLGLHIAAPTGEQMRSAWAWAAETKSKYGNNTEEAREFAARVDTLLASYLRYADRFKALYMNVQKGTGRIVFVEQYVSSEKEGMPVNGRLTLPSDENRYRHSARWEGGDWAFERYQSLFTPKLPMLQK